MPPNPDAGIGPGFAGFLIVVFVFTMAGYWGVFSKAGRPGWMCLIPIYNYYVVLKIGYKPGWWLLLFFVPFVNFIVAILMFVALANSFRKGAGFALGLMFLPFVFFPILAFGDAKYVAAPPLPK
jgi:hypothetical protein